MTFAQWRNRLMTHFSERIPVVKRRMTVHLKSHKWRPHPNTIFFSQIWIRFVPVFPWQSRCPPKLCSVRQKFRDSSSHKNTKFLTCTKISTFSLLGPNIYSSSTVFSRTLTERYSKMRGICGDWRLEIVECGLTLRRMGNGCAESKIQNK